MTFVVNRRVAKLFACLTILLLLFALPGCLTQAMEGNKGDEVGDLEPEASAEEVVELLDEDDKVDDGENAGATEKEEEQTEGTTSEATPAKKVTVTLYFADESGEKLIAETRQIEVVEGLARATMEELLKGPTTPGAKAVIPEGTKLIDINIKADGSGIIDLSRDLAQKHSGGSTAELLTVYSIVNTYAQFNTVDQVQILIGSQKVDSLSGHVTISQPIEPDESLVK